MSSYSVIQTDLIWFIGDREWHKFTASLPEKQRELQHKDRIDKGLVLPGTPVPPSLTPLELNEEMYGLTTLFL